MRGRHTAYSPDVAAALCARVAAGESLHGICAEAEMPSRAGVHRWRLTRPEFAAMLEAAMAQRDGLAWRAARAPRRPRPAVYSEALAREVCRRLAEGAALNAVARDPLMPMAATVRSWRRTRAGFGAMYQAAVAARAALYGTAEVRGRPTTYSEAAGDAVCARIAAGMLLRDLEEDEALPARSTVFRWLRREADFAVMYLAACEQRAEAIAEEAVEIADDDGADHWVRPDGGMTPNVQAVRRARLRIEARRLKLQRLDPRTDWLALHGMGRAAEDGEPAEAKLSYAERLRLLM